MYMHKYTCSCYWHSHISHISLYRYCIAILLLITLKLGKIQYENDTDMHSLYDALTENCGSCTNI